MGLGQALLDLESAGVHLDDARRQCERARRYAAELGDSTSVIAASIDVTAGMMSAASGRFGEALELERRCGIAINHETHRSRALFTPWTTAAP